MKITQEEYFPEVRKHVRNTTKIFEIIKIDHATHQIVRAHETMKVSMKEKGLDMQKCPPPWEIDHLEGNQNR